MVYTAAKYSGFTQSSIFFASSKISFKGVHVAQVDARDVLDVRQVLRQSELAAAFQVDRASVGADVADHADDGPGEDTWNTREGTLRKKSADWCAK